MPDNIPSQTRPNPAHESVTEKLIRCEMVHPNGKGSTRFISLELFLLWAHMMRTRHNMECKEYSISLWVPADEYQKKSGIFSHSGNIEQVNRFDFLLFDATYNYPYQATRFVLESDSERFKQAMSSHIPQELQLDGRLEIEKTPGYCIAKDSVNNGDHIVLGLFSGLHDIY
jgi:hypothetical protein